MLENPETITRDTRIRVIKITGKKYMQNRVYENYLQQVDKIFYFIDYVPSADKWGVVLSEYPYSESRRPEYWYFAPEELELVEEEDVWTSFKRALSDV